MRRFLMVVVGVLLLGGAFGAGWLLSGLGVGRSVPVDALDARERAFADRMQDVVLDGRFTVDWPEPREGQFGDRYEVASVEKLDGNRWRFNARIVYGSVDVTVPVIVPIEWAGDLPVIRLVNASLPGLGKEFGATVVFDGDRYGGTWDHGEVGGFMFGTIHPAGEADAEASR